jgi:hypothetical protein
MKKLIAVGILLGALAVSAIPALAQTTSCTQIGNQVFCNSYQPYQPPVHTTCTQIGNQVFCNTY